jgi:hypothetical protein
MYMGGSKCFWNKVTVRQLCFQNLHGQPVRCLWGKLKQAETCQCATAGHEVKVLQVLIAMSQFELLANNKFFCKPEVS